MSKSMTVPSQLTVIMSGRRLSKDDNVHSCCVIRIVLTQCIRKHPTTQHQHYTNTNSIKVTHFRISTKKIPQTKEIKFKAQLLLVYYAFFFRFQISIRSFLLLKFTELQRTAEQGKATAS